MKQQTIFFSIHLIFILPTIIITISPQPYIDWCMYWRYFNKDQYRPECNGIYRLRMAKYKAMDMSRQLKEIRRQPQTFHKITSPNLLMECIATATNCRQSTVCNSGQLCVDSSGYCCAPKTVLHKCPPPETLATAGCKPNRQRRFVSWCNIDAECSPKLAPRKNNFIFDFEDTNQLSSLCCPTQCGYNVCVR